MEAPAAAPAQWQLDFCSRPLLDDRGKKLWELNVTDEARSFEHSQVPPPRPSLPSQPRGATAHPSSAPATPRWRPAPALAAAPPQ